MKARGSRHRIYNGQYVLEELCDVFSAAFGPHPWVGVVVECGGHDVLLNLNPVLFALITVVMGHVEPAEPNAHTRTSVNSARVGYFNFIPDPVARTVSNAICKAG